MIRLAILLLVLPACITPCYGQNTIGLPEITNFSTLQFRAGTQTWDMQQDKNGILYFANNDGLLSFDGAYWKLYQVPNKTIVRSVAIDSSTGRIYTGAQDEIGYFEPDGNGSLRYHSLKGFIPPSSGPFTDVWNVILHQDAVFFRTYDRIFMLRDNKIQVFSAPEEWELLAKTGNRLFAKDKTKGLLVFSNGTWETECNTAMIQHLLITAILPYRADTLLITTLKNGLFLLHEGQLTPWHTQADQALKESRIYCARQINGQWFAIGTTAGGCTIIDHDGREIQQLSRAEGLQNNNILSLFVDRSQNLWMGLDNGIDLVAFNAAVKHIYPGHDNPITGYAIRIFHNELYIGTSNGAYSVPLQWQTDLSFSKGHFSLVADTKGQVWNFTEMNNQLLMGHHEGAFIIRDNKAWPLLPGIASWLFTPLSPIAPSPYLLAGTYTGLQALSYKDGVFRDEGKVEGITESLRFITVDNNLIWASHPYRGVFKIQLSANHKKVEQYHLYTQADGLPTSLNNYVQRVRDQIVITTEKGVYEYNAASNRFVPSAFFTPLFTNETVRYLTEDREGNIWFISNQRAGVIDFQKPANGRPYSIVYFPELNGRMVAGFEQIYPYNRDNIFIGARKGIYHINYNKYTNTGNQLNVLLSAVKIIDAKDSIIFGGYNSQQVLSLPNKTNSLHFEYASPAFAQENIEFSYRLEGFDKEWSSWSGKTEKDYTNLPYGNYTFTVKVRNNLGQESLPVTYTFKVQPAWYQTNWAVLGYLLLLAAIVYAVVKWQQRKLLAQQLQHEEEQRKIKYLHQLELSRNESEIVKLQNDKLESDVLFKNRELANATMHLVERGKLMSKIREELVQVLKHLQQPAISDSFKSIMRLLNDAEKSDDDWENFAVHFDEVHSNFLSSLKNKYPVLSATDLKLCAYLRMNLSSKEIAQLMNISLKGVEVSRSRLRKKLQLSPEVNLFDFLIQSVS
jgi:ligand-binding sensor domain-containing protein/DNA-binding CsgD family transcriptional regulator